MKKRHKSIVLTGFMSSGKTSVALALGNKLNRKTIDLDEVVMRIEQRTPREIIEQDGEAAFRAIETRALKEVLVSNSADIIALGGGAWMTETNRDLIHSHHCETIWLDAPFDLCWNRIPAGGAERPFAKTRDAARSLYELRRPCYSLARIHIGIDNEKSIEQIVDEIELHVR